MLRIAVVEDETAVRESIVSYAREYAQERGLSFSMEEFPDAESLLSDYRPVYDIIFTDIEMPGIDGMEAAKRIRELDGEVVLVFITNMAQYAIGGYAVGALDFVLKPVNYFTLALKLDRAIDRVKKRAPGQLILHLPEGVVKLDTRQIYYVEIEKRMLHYHTELGEYILRGTLQKAQEELERYHFARCNYWYLVNLQHVSEVRRDTVVVAGHTLDISRRNKTAFLTALTEFAGGGL